MIPLSRQSNQIGKIWLGPGTGDITVQTEDGTIWQSVRYLPELGTGDRRGVLVCDKVFEDHRER